MKIHWTYWKISKLGWETKFSPVFSKHNKITLSLLTKETIMQELPRARNKESQLYLHFIPLNTLIQKPTNINRKLHQQFIKSLQESHMLSRLIAQSRIIFFLQQTPVLWKDFSLHITLSFLNDFIPWFTY